MPDDPSAGLSPVQATVGKLSVPAVLLTYSGMADYCAAVLSPRASVLLFVHALSFPRRVEHYTYQPPGKDVSPAQPAWVFRVKLTGIGKPYVMVVLPVKGPVNEGYSFQLYSPGAEQLERLLKRLTPVSTFDHIRRQILGEGEDDDDAEPVAVPAADKPKET